MQNLFSFQTPFKFLKSIHWPCCYNRELTTLGRERRPRLHKTKTAITEIEAVQLCRKQFERPFIPIIGLMHF